MKTEDLKNYIFEQCLTEAKMHPLVMRGAQWVIDQIGGYDGPDAKKLARRMSTGIKRTTNKPTAEHVYNAAQFHYGEILRKHSPSMDRPEVYTNMRTQLRAHLGLDGEVNETSPERATALARARDDEGLKASEAGYLAAKHSVKIQKNPKNLDQRKIDAMNSATVQLMDLASEKFSKARKARNRSLGRKGDGSLRTPKQESAFNFIMGLKRLSEENSEHTRIDKMSLPEKKKFYNAIRGEKVSDQEDREERRERLDLIKHARNSIKNHTT